MNDKKNVNDVNVEQLFNLDRDFQAKARIGQIQISGHESVDRRHSQPGDRQRFLRSRPENHPGNPTVFDLDEPPVLLGKNLGINPVEYLLVALSGCMTTAMVTHRFRQGDKSKGRGIPV